jgi:hypothetical protein
VCTSCSFLWGEGAVVWCDHSPLCSAAVVLYLWCRVTTHLSVVLYMWCGVTTQLSVVLR